MLHLLCGQVLVAVCLERLATALRPLTEPQSLDPTLPASEVAYIL